MATKKIFVNADKVRRAEEIYLMLTDKRPKEKYSDEHIANLKERFGEFIKEAKVSLTNKEAMLELIYEKLGGVTRTPEEQARIKPKGNISRTKAKKEEKVDEDDDEDEGDDDGDGEEIDE